MKPEPKLTKADRKRLKELQLQRRHLARNFYHPAIWYGCDDVSAKELIAEERARLDAEIDAVLNPPEETPVLVGVIVDKPTQGALW